MPINDIVLTSGSHEIAIPQVGFGVWQVPDAEVDAAVLSALETGYRHIDTAKLYNNEAGVGRALAATDVPREDVFVTTKVWPTEFGAQETVDSFNASMDRLGLETLDLFLLHWPFPATDRYIDAWAALKSLRDAGRVRAIGVCNFHPDHLQRLFDETGEWPSINQVELHPYLQQHDVVEFNAEHGIVTESWSPLASGKQVLEDPVIGAIASRLGATPAQVIIAWHVARGFVVLPKSVTPSRIAENLAAAELTLTEADLAEIATLDRGFRTGPNPDEFNG
ncbi:aldo/keto reductase [Knoellia subterranea]|uniref:Oxidoreductase n=1 Tax=Knoellia subterranea KCTC 19937 TaxID=1385521 RepID=A0A0A0JID0_9MICO|nr:aldo/keto reductase [Knoellia subterranea]KGN36878.1 oxidoreductase [Knoellia subterranea KCTC 19937]